MKTLIASILLLAAAPFSHANACEEHPQMTHLKFAKGKIHVHATWVQGPRSPGESILRLEWKNGTDHSAIEPPGSFKVVLWMPDMGHGSAPTKIQQVVDEIQQPLVGVYAVTNVYFTMGGKWDVNVKLKYDDRTEETQTIKVELGGHGGGHGGHQHDQ